MIGTGPPVLPERVSPKGLQRVHHFRSPFCAVTSIGWPIWFWCTQYSVPPETACRPKAMPKGEAEHHAAEADVFLAGGGGGGGFRHTRTLRRAARCAIS